MVKKEAWRIFLVLFVILVLLWACFMAYVFSMSNHGNIIDLDIEDGECKNVEFKRFHILPGESCSYLLRLNMKTHGKYKLQLDFERIGGDDLEKYVNVKVLVGGRTLCDTPLKELLTSESRGISYVMSSSIPENIEIIYCMSDVVGNEAQGAFTTFDLNIKANLLEE